MPKPFRYKNGALIYCNGEEADRVFILQSGKISLVFDDIETGKTIKETVQPGEFFGVKSALGRFPREENAIALADSVVAYFTVAEFELFAISNTKIILNMLKVFSNQMRQIHSKVSSLLEDDKIKPDEGLFGIGERYLKEKRYSQAKYIFNRYLECYPIGKDAVNAEKNLHLTEIALIRGAQGEILPAQKIDAKKTYNEGMNLINNEKYKEAMGLFILVARSKEDPEWVLNSIFEIGRCLYFLNQFEDCLKHFQNMFSRYPDHADTKDAMYYTGQACEKTGQKDTALSWYKKIIAMPHLETDETFSKTLQALDLLEKSL